MLRAAPLASPPPRGALARGGHAPRSGARRVNLLPRPVATAASTDLLTALTTDAAYLGLASSLVAVSGWPLLSKEEGLAGVDLTTADATRRTPRPAWVLSTVLSFLPLINFTSWLLLMVTEGSKPRYWLCAALYALPFVVTAVGGPGGETLALEAAALCAMHFQVERLVLASADARAIKAGEEVPEAADAGSGWLAAAAEEELASFDARLGARLAKGDRLRSLAAAARVPRAKSGRVGEVSAALEAAVAGVAPASVPPPGGSGRAGAAVAAASCLEAEEEGGAPASHLSSVRAELIAEAQAALEKAGGKGRRRRRRAEEEEER